MLRNREIRQFSFWFLLITVVAVTLGFIINSAAGILAMAFSVAFGVVFWAFTKARYKSVAQISDQIDRVLHHADELFIGESEEGELSILQSEITKMTRRIREQNEALEKEKKYLADSLADIAHQLRTPLTSANLILSLLENSADDKERKALLRETEGLFSQMDWLLNSLLKLSRMDAGIVVFKREPIELNTLISVALHPFLIFMELHYIEVRIDVPEWITIGGDFGWLSEAVQNVLKNCMESAGDSGKIEITGADNPLFTEITIRDNGTGFEKDDLACLFDRFYRGKKAGTTGYGIGLALSKMIINKQGGMIIAKNHQKGGAVFTIRFPK